MNKRIIIRHEVEDDDDDDYEEKATFGNDGLKMETNKIIRRNIDSIKHKLLISLI